MNRVHDDAKSSLKSFQLPSSNTKTKSEIISLGMLYTQTLLDTRHLSPKILLELNLLSFLADAHLSLTQWSVNVFLPSKMKKSVLYSKYTMYSKYTDAQIANKSV